MIKNDLWGNRMKNYETEITLSGRKYRIFLQPGFFNYSTGRVTPHVHKYCELHCIFSGEAEYNVAGERYRLGPGAFILIPGNHYHSYTAFTEGIHRCSFQIAELNCGVRVATMAKGVAEGMMSELLRYDPERDFTMLSSYISLLLAQLADGEPLSLRTLTDREFLVNEFFANNYDRCITLEELANILSLSPKQTQRTVVRYTGRSFRDELSYRRVRAARELLREGRMSLSEVAERVGYQSYSGFWRAYNRFLREEEE